MPWKWPSIGRSSCTSGVVTERRPLSLQAAVALCVVSLGRSQHAARHLTRPNTGLRQRADRSQPVLTPADYLMGMADSTRLLESFTIRRPAEIARDLGTGCGFHASWRRAT